MMRRWLASIVVAAAAVGVALPAAANHDDKHCTLTVHHPLGTDDVEVTLPDEVPSDIGFVKVFVNCRHGNPNR